MDKWVCTVCGYVYDPAVGDTANNISAGTSFEASLSIVPASSRSGVSASSSAGCSSACSSTTIQSYDLLFIPS